MDWRKTCKKLNISFELEEKKCSSSLVKHFWSQCDEAKSPRNPTFKKPKCHLSLLVVSLDGTVTRQQPLISFSWQGMSLRSKIMTAFMGMMGRERGHRESKGSTSSLPLNMAPLNQTYNSRNVSVWLSFGREAMFCFVGFMPSGSCTCDVRCSDEM